MHAKKRLSSRILTFLLIVAVFPVLILAGIWAWSDYRMCQAEDEVLRQDLMEIYQRQLRKQVDRVVGDVEHLIEAQEQRIARYARQQTDMAYALIESLAQSDDAVTTATRQEIVGILKDLRFYGEQGYCFIIQGDGVAVMIADRPELEGMDMTHYQDSQGQYFVQHMMELSQGPCEGYCRYTWSKPGTEGSDYLKTSFVRYFEPFDWIIGSGFYWQDLEEELKQQALARIEVHENKEEYRFAGQYDGLILVGPGSGRNLMDVTDREGVSMTREFIRTAREGGGFVFYMLPDLDEYRSAQKMSYVRPVEAWDWFVGAGIYLDAIDSLMESKQVELQNALQRKLLVLAATTLLFVSLALFMAQRVGRSIRKSINMFERFFNKAAEELTLIDTRRFRFQEFEVLAQSANAMIAGRQKVERERIASERRYRTLIDNIPQKVFMKDRASTFISCNRSLADDLGIEPEEIAGKTDFDFFPEDLAQKYRIDDECIMVAGQVEDIEETNQVGDRRRIVQVTKAPVRDDKRQVIGILGVYWDITDRKEAEERLRMSETVLNQAQRIAHFGHWEWEIDSGRRHWSGALLRILGLSPDNANESTDTDILQEAVHVADRTTRLHAIQDITEAARDSYAVEYRIVRPDGDIRHIHEIGEAALVAPDQPRQVLGVIHDVTDRRLHEEEVRRSEEEALAMSQRLTRLLEVTNALSEAETLDALNQLVVQAGQDQLQYERMELWYYDQKRRELHGAFRINETGTIIDRRRVRRPLGTDEPITRVIDLCKTYQSPEDSNLFDTQSRVVGRGTTLIAPLWDGARVNGVLMVDNLLTGAPFTDNRARLLELYASMIGHLYRLKKSQELVRQQDGEIRLFGERLKILHDLCNQAAVMSDLESLCRQATLTGRMILDVDRMGIWFLDAASESLEVAPGMNAQENICDQNGQEIFLRRFTLAHRMIRDGVSFHIEPNLETPCDDRGVGARPGALALMTCGREVVGLIGVDNVVSRRLLSDSQGQILTLLADLLAHHVVRLRHGAEGDRLDS